MRCGGPGAGEAEWDQGRIDCDLAQLDGLTVKEVSRHKPGERAWVRAALRRFHYLGFGGAVGENLQYVVRDGAGRPLACLVFGAAAWKCQDRDQFIGWSAGPAAKEPGVGGQQLAFFDLAGSQKCGI